MCSFCIFYVYYLNTQNHTISICDELERRIQNNKNIIRGEEEREKGGEGRVGGEKKR